MGLVARWCSEILAAVNSSAVARRDSEYLQVDSDKSVMSSETPLPSPQQNVKPKDYYAKFTVCTPSLPFQGLFSPNPWTAGSKNIHGIHRVRLNHIPQHEITQRGLIVHARTHQRRLSRVWTKTVTTETNAWRTSGRTKTASGHGYASCCRVSLVSILKPLVVLQIDQRRADRQRGRQTPI